MATIGELAETSLGKMLDRSKPRGLPSVPYLRNINVQWDHINVDDILTMELADPERERFQLEPGDLLVCEGGEVGRCAIWHGGTEYMAYQKALHRVRTGPDICPRYLLHALSHLAGSGALARFSTGSTISHLPQERLRAVSIPVPFLAEQRRIVDILEDHLSRLDASASYVESARRHLTAHRRAMLEQLFGQAQSTQLVDLVEGIQAGRSFGVASTPAGPDEWGIIKVSAMTWGSFRPEENKAVPSAQVDARNEIREGDLLVSRANTSEYVGASVLVGKVREKLLLSDKSLRVLPRHGVNAEWLWRALQAPASRSQITGLATGTKDSMRNISQKALLQVGLPDPRRVDQESDLARFREVDDAAAELERSLSDLSRRADVLRRALLASAFSGQLTGHSSDMDLVQENAGV